MNSVLCRFISVLGKGGNEARDQTFRPAVYQPSHFFPTSEMPFMHVTHIKDKMSNFGISQFSHFFLARPQQALAAMLECRSAG